MNKTKILYELETELKRVSECIRDRLEEDDIEDIIDVDTIKHHNYDEGYTEALLFAIKLIQKND